MTVVNWQLLICQLPQDFFRQSGEIVVFDGAEGRHTSFFQMLVISEKDEAKSN